LIIKTRTLVYGVRSNLKKRKRFVGSNGEALIWMVDSTFGAFRIVPKDENDPYKNVKIMVDGKAAYIGRHRVELTTQPDTFIWNLVDVKESDSKITCKIQHIYGGNRYWSYGTYQYSDSGGGYRETSCIEANRLQETFTIEERWIFD
jgi:hypothetical protein